MATIGELVVQISADTRGMNAALDAAQKKVGGFGKGLADVAKIAGGFVVAQGLMQLPGLFGGAADAASDLAESVNKSSVVFGASSAAIEEWAGKAAKGLGQSKQQALEAAGTFGNLFTAMGLGQSEAAGLSTDIVGLASDLASFNNIDPAEALEKLRAGLVGEAEPLRTLGVNLNEAAVQEKAFAMGLATSKADLTDAAKIQARYALILEQSTNAQGDFARTADGAANKQRIMNAQLADAQAKVGAFILPLKVGLVTLLVDKVIPAVSSLAEEWLPKLQGAFDAVKGVIEPVAAALKGPLSEALAFLDEHKEILVAFAATVAVLLVPALWAWVAAEIAKTAAMLAAAAAFVLANAPIIAVAAAIGVLVLGIIELVKHWDDILPKIKAIWGAVLDFFTGTVGPFFTETIPGFFISLKDKVTGVISGLVTWLGDNWKTIVQVALAVLFPPGAGLFWIATHFGEVKDSVLGFIGNIIGAIEGLPGRILAFLGSWLDAGKQLAGAFLDGLRQVFSAAGDVAGDIARTVVNAIIELINSQVIDRINSLLEFTIPGPGPLPDIHVNPPDIGHIPSLAAGVRNFRGGLAVVGERGPELLALPRGADVYSAGESRRALSRPAVAGGVTINYTNYGRYNVNLPNARDYNGFIREQARQLRGL